LGFDYLDDFSVTGSIRCDPHVIRFSRGIVIANIFHRGRGTITMSVPTIAQAGVAIREHRIAFG